MSNQQTTIQRQTTAAPTVRPAEDVQARTASRAQAARRAEGIRSQAPTRAAKSFESLGGPAEPLEGPVPANHAQHVKSMFAAFGSGDEDQPELGPAQTRSQKVYSLEENFDRIDNAGGRADGMISVDDLKAAAAHGEASLREARKTAEYFLTDPLFSDDRQPDHRLSREELAAAKAQAEFDFQWEASERHPGFVDPPVRMPA